MSRNIEPAFRRESYTFVILFVQMFLIYQYLIRYYITSATSLYSASLYSILPQEKSQFSSPFSPANRNVHPFTKRFPSWLFSSISTLTTSYFAVSYMRRASSCSSETTLYAHPLTRDSRSSSTRALYLPPHVLTFPPWIRAGTNACSSGGEPNSSFRNELFPSVP
jgi:hypothetical protein